MPNLRYHSSNDGTTNPLYMHNCRLPTANTRFAEFLPLVPKMPIFSDQNILTTKLSHKNAIRMVQGLKFLKKKIVVVFFSTFWHFQVFFLLKIRGKLFCRFIAVCRRQIQHNCRLLMANQKYSNCECIMCNMYFSRKAHQKYFAKQIKLIPSFR